MDDVKIIIRTADQTRKAEVTMSRENTGGDVLQAAIGNWSLPTDTDYTLVNTVNQKSIAPNQPLTADLVGSGDLLQIQPVLVAG